MSEVAVLDVGHGNAAVVRCASTIAVVDAPVGSTLAEFIETTGITSVALVVASHADADHINGLTTLMLDRSLRIDLIVAAADTRSSRSWERFRVALADARSRYPCTVVPGATTGQRFEVGGGEAVLECVSPSPEDALGGAGGKAADGSVLTANSLSIALRVVVGGQPLVLLTGDIDARAIDKQRSAGTAVEAPVLVFPHHGGRTGDDNGREAARSLAAVVRPQVVIFSLSRDAYGNPRPEVVAGVREGAAGSHIICTQLSKACAASPAVAASLSSLPARGRATNSCCGGSIVLRIVGGKLEVVPPIEQHRAFVRASAESALCTR